MINLARLPLSIDNESGRNAHHAPIIGQIYTFAGIDLDYLNARTEGLLYALDGRTLDSLTGHAVGRSEVKDRWNPKDKSI